MRDPGLGRVAARKATLGVLYANQALYMQ